MPGEISRGGLWLSVRSLSGLDRLPRARWPRGTTVALGLLLLGGIFVRAVVIHSYRPGFVGYPDAIGYIAAARLKGPAGLLFFNQYRPAGYPLFLTWLHGIDSILGFVVTVQHLMGLATALLLYVTVAPFVQHRWVALLPVTVICFSGMEVLLEHSILSETLYTFLVVGALFCSSRAITSRGWWDLSWLGAAGVLMGFSVPVRSAGIFVVPALILWAVASRPGWKRRLLRGLVPLFCFAGALFSYLSYQHQYTHSWEITRTTGETLYARTAVFADCKDFTPPDGTRKLCAVPVAGFDANTYMFSPASPVATTFPAPSDPRVGQGFSWGPDSKLESFAEAAIVHQPLDLLWTTVQGMVGYVDPSAVPADMLEFTNDGFAGDDEVPPSSDGPAEIEAYYPGTAFVAHPTGTLWISRYFRWAQIEGPVTAILILLMVVGFVRARGQHRTIIGLLGWTTALMMVSPVLVLFYGVRYAAPSYGPMAATAAVGLDLAVSWWLASSRRIPRLRRRAKPI
jgi:hypothetical protein